MSKIAYFDCPTGIAGDMCLGALIHAGTPLSYLRSQLARLGIEPEYHLFVESVQRNQQAATKFHVQLKDPPQSGGTGPEAAGNSDGKGLFHSHGTHSHGTHSHGTHSHGVDSHSTHDHDAHGHSHKIHSHESHPDAQRNLTAIARLIRQAKLPPRAEAWSLAVFRNLAIAEAAVHGTTIEAVHFHEVGAVDAIVDIVGTCLGLDYLDIDEIYCAPLPTGGGTVWAAHGRLPVPAPAVLKLFCMGQVPVYSNGIERELVTPTGAAIAITLAQRFGPPPPMSLQTVGLGAGTIDLPIPNMLRLWIGESAKGESNRSGMASFADAIESDRDRTSELISEDSSQDITPEIITLLQTQLDDVSPQAIGYAFEQLLEAGALDVFTQAIAMKKNRPGVLLSVLCADEKVADCEAILFRETSTLGVRRQVQQRSILQRHWQTVDTAYGSVRIKVAQASLAQVNQDAAQAPLNAQPEYEDCVAIARTHNLPWRDVHQLALQAWHQTQA